MATAQYTWPVWVYLNGVVQVVNAALSTEHSNVDDPSVLVNVKSPDCATLPAPSRERTR